LTLADLSRERFILFPRRIGPRLYDAILTLYGEAGFSPEAVVEAFPAQSIVALAACDLGVGFIASEVQHFRRPMAVYRRLTGPAPSLTLGVAFRADDASPLTAALAAAAEEAGAGVR
jgi:DNA-binding transcriptional LysR family regulator